jgi:hypothetical protein
MEGLVMMDYCQVGDPPTEIGRWVHYDEPRLVKVDTTARDWMVGQGSEAKCHKLPPDSPKPTTVYFEVDYWPQTAEGEDIACHCNGRYLRFHLPGSNTKVYFHRQLFHDEFWNKNGIVADLSMQVDHKCDSPDDGAVKNNLLCNFEFISPSEHGKRTRSKAKFRAAVKQAEEERERQRERDDVWSRLQEKQRRTR